MVDEEKRLAPSETVLTELLAKLDEVMAEAERLRGQVSRQLAEHRSNPPQKITELPRRTPTSRPRR